MTRCLVCFPLSLLLPVGMVRSQTLHVPRASEPGNAAHDGRADAKPLLHPGANQLRVVFYSAIASLPPKVKAMDVKLPTVMQSLRDTFNGTAFSTLNGSNLAQETAN